MVENFQRNHAYSSGRKVLSGCNKQHCKPCFLAHHLVAFQVTINTGPRDPRAEIQGVGPEGWDSRGETRGVGPKGWGPGNLRAGTRISEQSWVQCL